MCFALRPDLGEAPKWPAPRKRLGGQDAGANKKMQKLQRSYEDLQGKFAKLQAANPNVEPEAIDGEHTAVPVPPEKAYENQQVLHLTSLADADWQVAAPCCSHAVRTKVDEARKGAKEAACKDDKQDAGDPESLFKKAQATERRAKQKAKSAAAAHAKAIESLQLAQAEADQRAQEASEAEAASTHAREECLRLHLLAEGRASGPAQQASTANFSNADDFLAPISKRLLECGVVGADAQEHYNAISNALACLGGLCTNSQAAGAAETAAAIERATSQATTSAAEADRAGQQKQEQMDEDDIDVILGCLSANVVNGESVTGSECNFKKLLSDEGAESRKKMAAKLRESRQARAVGKQGGTIKTADKFKTGAGGQRP